MCQAMLKMPAVKDAFEQFAKVYLQQIKSKLKEGSLEENFNEEIAEEFLDAVSERFPLVFVDHSLENPDDMGYHARRRMDPNQEEFDTHNQAIVLNGVVSGL